VLRTEAIKTAIPCALFDARRENKRTERGSKRLFLGRCMKCDIAQLSGATTLAYPQKNGEASQRNKSKHLYQSVNTKKDDARIRAQGNEVVPRNRYVSCPPISLVAIRIGEL
jgi:hypothetical protein